MPASKNASQDIIRALIQKVATGAEMSRNISREDACEGMRLILDGDIPDVQAAVFLIGLRMKRETLGELAGLMDALLESVVSVNVDCEDLVDVSDIYNGYARYLPITPFLPPLLAACGLPAVCHGVVSLGPKHGITLHTIYAHMGVDTSLTPQHAADKLQQTGWVYMNQAQFNPKLHRLIALRDLMIKRTALHTLEGLCRPLRSTGRNHLLTGYVHTNYLQPYAQLAQQVGYDSAFIARGLEGGATVLPTKAVTCATMQGQAPFHCFETHPNEIGIKKRIDLERIQKEANALNITRTVDAGTTALQGKDSPFREPLIYAAALFFQHLQRESSLQKAAKRIEKVLDTGLAFEVLKT